MSPRNTTTDPARIPHGNGGYNNWGCRCTECRAAHSEWLWTYRNRLANLPFEDKPHGTDNGYVNYRCRCAECRAAHADLKRQRGEVRS